MTNTYPISQHYAKLGSTHKDVLTDSAGQHNMIAPSILINTTLLNPVFQWGITDMGAKSVHPLQIFDKLQELEKLIFKCHFSSTAWENSLDLEEKTFWKAA